MAELGLAAVSLLFQVFSGCVQGYELITDARQMPSDCHHLRICLKTEQYRFLDWAEVIGLDENDEKLLLNHTSKAFVLDILEQQRKCLYQFGRLDDKYKKLANPLLVDFEEGNSNVPDPPPYSPIEEGPVLERIDSNFQRKFPRGQKLLQKSLNWSRSTRTYPRRLKWAAFDKQKMEGLVVRLKHFNDIMRETLNTVQLGTLSDRQKRTEFQIMQLNNSVNDLVQIFKSAHFTMNLAQPFLPHRFDQDLMQVYDVDYADKDIYGRSGLQSLATLAQFKALNSAIEDPNLFNDEFTSSINLHASANEIRSVELSKDDIEIDGEEADDVTETYRTEAFFKASDGTKVSAWIEWKMLDTTGYQLNGAEPKVRERIRALTALLKENHKNETKNNVNRFRAPHCLGYFQDEEENRFGLVFSKPSSVQQDAPPISLHKLLTNQDLDIPSLTDRIVLMRLLSETVEQLHAVNWLHKGLRSSNILFFSKNNMSTINYSDPYVSGFDYSRPAMSEEMTEKPPEHASSDIYRHPHVQGSGNRDTHNTRGGFKKSYDIYALGIILLEVAYWKPIDQIVGIENLSRAKPSQTTGAKEKLLSEKAILKYVNSHLGTTVEGVVRACLVGPTAFGLTDDDDEKEEEVGATLQSMFYERVVRELGCIKV